MAELSVGPSEERGLVRWLQRSTVPYVSSLVVTVMLAGWANYLQPLVLPEDFAIKGQSLAIVIPLVGFPVSLALWFACRGQRTGNRWLTAVLLGLAVSWVAHMALLYHHSDLYPHTTWLFLPVLAMLLLKTPSSREAWNAVNVFAWLAVVILVVTRLLEMFGGLPVYHLAEWIVWWERARYWLPLSDAFGLLGRWPGPFGYSSKTGFICALLVLIGLARLRWSSIVFVVVGVIGVLLTGGRGAALSLAAGAFVLVLLAASGPISRVPVAVRAAIGGAAVLAFGLFFFRSPMATNGRLGQNGIWSAFSDLWETSPWLGVGQTGILADERAGRIMEAHNLFLQELTRSGIVGFVFQFTVILIGLGLAGIAAYRGLAWPLAILAAYYVASLTEVFQDGWLNHSTYSLLIILCFTASAQWISERSSIAAAVPIEPGRADESARIPAG